ncbi:hypothetical protein [Chondromyces crocatus]|uniref:Uncharacterized protein n=1 Tax=Chondromyces crocatus TaxID=52 RepID=A0A0K1ESK6_CHOCO|nr:hypothetical protein [Chondromyces crocatus]AKT43622.1 uncharacterized protein CMC5_078570 [Chondromyces crocatus]
MNSTKKFFLAAATAIVTAAVPAVASAGAPLQSCNSSPCDSAGLLSAIGGLATEVTKLKFAGAVEDVQLASVDDMVEANDVDAHVLGHLMLLNSLNALALQSVLSDLIVIASNEELLTVAELLSENAVGLSDVLAVKLLEDTLIVFYQGDGPKGQSQGQCQVQGQCQSPCQAQGQNQANCMGGGQ